MRIDIAREFTRIPGPRTRKQGDGSGQEFRERLLRPRFEEARDKGEKLVIGLDGVTYGYPTSFLEEAFGGLARRYGIPEVLQTLAFDANEEPMLRREIEHYIRHANEKNAAIFDPEDS